MLSLILCALPVHAAPALQMQNGEPVVVDGGVVTPLQGYGSHCDKMRDYLGTASDEMIFCDVGEETTRDQGIATGLYFFDEKGKMLKFFKYPNAGFCSDVRLSPGGQYLAAGTCLNRNCNWDLYHTADLKPVGTVAYVHFAPEVNLFWNGLDEVVYNTPADIDSKRTCSYGGACDPPVSVALFSLKTGKTRILFDGTDLCDYRIASLNAETGEYEVKKLCRPTPEAWDPESLGEGEEDPLEKSAEHIKGTLHAQ